MRLVFAGIPGEITTLPGNSQIAVSHHVFCPIPLRKKGRGTLANIERLKALKNLGYDYVICTVDKNNEAQIRILDKNGWNPLAGFVSSKTHHDVAIYGKVL